MFSKYTFSVISLGATSLGSLKELIKIHLSNQPLEGWVTVFPILSVSCYLLIHFSGILLNAKLNTSLILSSESFLFYITFSSIFLFTIYGNFLSSGLLWASIESFIIGVIVAALAVIIMKKFYRSKVRKITG